MDKKVELYIIHPADPLGYKIGGAETFIKGFVENSPIDFEIYFVGVSSDKNKRPPNRWQKLKLRNREFNFLPLFFEKEENKKSFIPLSLRFTLALKFSKVNFSNKVILFNRIEPAIFCKKKNTIRICIIHNDIQKQIANRGSEVLWSKLPWLYFLYEKLVFLKFDFIYTVSYNSFLFYKLRYPAMKDKIEFITTWVDDQVFSPSNEEKIVLRKRLKFLNSATPSLNDKWLLFVGRLQEQKAPIRLIEAFAIYNKNNSGSCFILIGEGNLFDSMNNLVVKLILKDKVFLLGSMDQIALADFYRASDVLVLTSNFEGMPICVLEALRCGLPVVTTNVGEIHRVIRNGFSGEIVEGFSPEEIAKKLEKVLNQKEIYSRNNCVNSVSEFTPLLVLHPIYERIRDLLANTLK